MIHHTHDISVSRHLLNSRLLEIFTIITVLSTSWSIFPTCRKTQFQCANKDCIDVGKYCNGIKDCRDGSDENLDCSPCNMTYMGSVGVTYELEVKRPAHVPFVCFLNFTAGGGTLGELIQLSFESFSVGTFESFTAAGCPDGHVSIREANRPAAGGQWCGGAIQPPDLRCNSEGKFRQGSVNNFEFKLSYKFLKVSDARIRYGNATQRSYRACRIQSPNYPGIYPRNVSCHYRVRERSVPQGKHALIAVRQANFHYKEHASKFDNSDRVLR
ncbi:unnamed protein product [Phaedon cochleariae]|uniref:CUB domain-containing protein n=1 Tax=Phaedon cochleariae TaxID=80249 RepID=A0A9N9X1W7_PHACE|nr:unnamed protein product [Phaedon cochleariae]